MTFEQRLKLFKRASARGGLYFALWLIRRLPYRLLQGVMHVFIFLWFRLSVRLRRIARESLKIALGDEIDEPTRKKIIRDCFENIGCSMTDLIYFTEYPGGVKEKFAIDGRQHLDAALALGRGVIIVTAHFGNFCLMMLELAQLGYPVNCIIRRARDAIIAQKIYTSMNKVGVKPIYSLPAARSVKESLAALKRNETLCILLDQHYGSGSGVMVDFFGRKAATATGPVVLANRTGAPVVPIFTIREGDRYRLIIEPPLAMEDAANEEEFVLVNVKRITRLIERYIRRYPAEWGWMHRRWKNRETA